MFSTAAKNTFYFTLYWKNCTRPVNKDGRRDSSQKLKTKLLHRPQINPVSSMLADETWTKPKHPSAQQITCSQRDILACSYHIDVCPRADFSPKFGFNSLFYALKNGLDVMIDSWARLVIGQMYQWDLSFLSGWWEEVEMQEMRETSCDKTC